MGGGGGGIKIEGHLWPHSWLEATLDYETLSTNRQNQPTNLPPPPDKWGIIQEHAQVLYIRMLWHGSQTSAPSKC